MRYQLRRYVVQDGRLEEFVELFRTGIVPLRRQYGFEVVGAWTIPESNEFVWIVGHENFEEAASAYGSSPERAARSPEPASLLTSISDWMMEPVPDD